MSQNNKSQSPFKSKIAELGRRERARRKAVGKMAGVERRSQPPRNDIHPALVVVDRPIDSRPARRKLRNLDPAHIAMVRELIAQLGFCLPILVSSDGEIIDGHIRFEAARQLCFTQIPSIVIDHLNPTELRLLRLALNRLGETGTWNIDELKIEFEELIEIDAPLEITGFEAAEIDMVTSDDSPRIDDPAEAVPEIDDRNPLVTRAGDAWLLDKHRIVCGDARDPSLYAILMRGVSARAILTDLPYNVPIAGHVSGLGKAQHREFAMASGEMSSDEFSQFLTDFLAAAIAHLVDGGLALIFMDWRGLRALLNAGFALKLLLLNLLVWIKSNAGMGSLWRSQHEDIAVFKIGAASHVNNVKLGKHGRWRSNALEYPGASSLGSDSRAGLEFHPTVKPVALLADVIRDVTNLGDIVLDPFLGSGSTLIAAETTGRVCYGIELDRQYMDVVLRRWRHFTGKEPILAATGQTFSEVAASRLAPPDGAPPGPNDSPSQPVTIIHPEAPNLNPEPRR